MIAIELGDGALEAVGAHTSQWIRRHQMRE